jgi:chromosome segregation ATPase
MIEKYLKILKMPIAVVGLIFVFLIIFNIKGCINERRSSEIARLEGLVLRLEEETSAQKERMEEEIGKKDEENKALEGDIADLTDKSEDINLEITKKNTEITRLEAEFEGLTDLQDRYNNVLRQNISLKSTVALERSDKGTLREMYDKALVIIENERESKLSALNMLKKQIDATKALKELNSELALQYKRSKRGSKIKETILTPFALFGGYKLIKGLV